MTNVSPALSTTESLVHEARAEALSQRYGSVSAREIVRAACVEMFPDRVAAVSSFGAEAAVLLHIIADVAPATPVIFLDTGKHFSETMTYMTHLVRELGLGVLVTAFPSKAQLETEDPAGNLHASDSDRCCHIRKTLPMMRALRPYEAFFTGRKQFQTEARSQMRPFEAYGRWIRVNPLWNWHAGEIRAYFDQHKLPQHPLVAQNFLSIGCEPCTRAVRQGDDVRAGRWAGTDKTECGIHFTADGRVVRGRGD